MLLCGNPLPWVKYGKHLGMKIQDLPGNLLSQDVKEKRAQFIQRNNELMQEFSFAAPYTKKKNKPNLQQSLHRLCLMGFD